MTEKIKGLNKALVILEKQDKFFDQILVRIEDIQKMLKATTAKQPGKNKK